MFNGLKLVALPNTGARLQTRESLGATVRAGSAEDDIAEGIFYIVEDHLNSVTARLNASNSGVIDRDGVASVRSFTYKRYRFTGKEKDSESGLYYYGARYYSP